MWRSKILSHGAEKNLTSVFQIKIRKTRFISFQVGPFESNRKHTAYEIRWKVFFLEEHRRKTKLQNGFFFERQIKQHPEASQRFWKFNIWRSISNWKFSGKTAMQIQRTSDFLVIPRSQLTIAKKIHIFSLLLVSFSPPSWYREARPNLIPFQVDIKFPSVSYAEILFKPASPLGGSANRWSANKYTSLSLWLSFRFGNEVLGRWGPIPDCPVLLLHLSPVVFKMWSPDRYQQHHLRSC